MKKEYTIRKKNPKLPVQTKKTGRMAFRKAMLCAILLGGTIYLTWCGIQDLQTTAQLRLSIQENKDKISDLEDQKKELEKTYQNLSNPDYARYFAMGRYHVTQDGEQVFIFPGDDEQKEDQ